MTLSDRQRKLEVIAFHACSLVGDLKADDVEYGEYSSWVGLLDAIKDFKSCTMQEVLEYVEQDLSALPYTLREPEISPEVQCKGCMALGNGCGKCVKCREELRRISNTEKKFVEFHKNKRVDDFLNEIREKKYVNESTWIVLNPKTLRIELGADGTDEPIAFMASEVLIDREDKWLELLFYWFEHLSTRYHGED